MDKVGGYRNYGYGKQLLYAGKQALKDRYGEGHYATQAAHTERWQQFVYYLKSQHINDTRKIDKSNIEDYARYIKEKVSNNTLTVSYAQNLLSSVNVILATMRKDTVLKISPAKWVGQRNHIRTQVPESLGYLSARSCDKNVSENVLQYSRTFSKKDKNVFEEHSRNINHLDNRVEKLKQFGQVRVAMLVLLTRHLGLRFREASLLDAEKAQTQAEQLGRINITQGTKGARGKSVDRWIPVNPDNLHVIKQVASHQRQEQNKHIIPSDMTFKQWKNHCYYEWNKANQSGNESAKAIKGFHDMRAAYACERYQQLTNHLAPVINHQQRTAPKPLDQQARQIIAKELGHGRISVMASYIGSSR